MKLKSTIATVVTFISLASVSWYLFTKTQTPSEGFGKDSIEASAAGQEQIDNESKESGKNEEERGVNASEKASANKSKASALKAIPSILFDLKEKQFKVTHDELVRGTLFEDISKKDLKAKIKKLDRHLVGYNKEKRAVYYDCKKRRHEFETWKLQGPSKDTLHCLYWQIQQLAVERKKSRLASKSVASAKKKNRNKVKARKIKTLAAWKKLGKYGYTEALRAIRLRKRGEGAKLLKIALKDRAPCKRRSAYLALFRELEEFLPHKKTYAGLEKIYKKVSSCYKPHMAYYEMIHFRMAMLRIHRDKDKQALKLLRLAEKAEKKSDFKRTLYWMGYLERKLEEVEQPESWKRLIREYPVTFHSIVAQKSLNIDPLDYINSGSKRKRIVGKSYHGALWDLENTAIFTLTALQYFGLKDSFRKLTAYLNKWLEPRSAEQYLYLAALYRSKNDYFRSTRYAQTAMKKSGWSHFNNDVLNLMYPLKYRQLVTKNVGEMNPAVVFALIHQESAFNPKAESHAGAAGLMQVMPGTGRQVLKKRKINLFDPALNVRAGAKFLNQLYRRNGEKISHTLASYNAGPSNVKSWEKRYPDLDQLEFVDIIPFKETRNYVSKLMGKSFWYSMILERKQKLKKRDSSQEMFSKLVPKDVHKR